MNISENAKIGDNVTIKEGVVIEAHAVVGDNCYLDYGCIIRENVTLGDNSYVGPRCILGEYNFDFYSERVNQFHPLIIGENALIRSNAVIYGGSTIGAHFQTGHNVTIREQTKIGDHSRLGTLSDIQGHCIIGNYVSCHSNVHIGMDSIIGDFAWIFPYVVLTNDPTPPSDVLRGVNVAPYAVISTGAIILPGIHIATNSLVGAGAIVNRNVPENTVVVGNPAKVICTTDRIKNQETGESVYPWPKHFDRGMPWEDTDYDSWLKENS